MSQPVKLSDDLVMEARTTGAKMQRSIAGQVEFWAKLGRAVERLTSGQHMERLQKQAAMSLNEALETVDHPEGKARLDACLHDRPFPRFSAHPKLARVFIREEADGRRTTGVFKRGVFQPSAARSRSLTARA